MRCTDEELHVWPGHAAGVRSYLGIEEVEKLRHQAESGTDEEVGRTLGQLMPHLDDRLVIVEKVPLPDHGICRLVVCTANDAERTELVLLVSSNGRVFACCAGDLAKSCERPLDGFDRTQDEIVSVVVTTLNRLVRELLDVIIVVRTSRDPGSDTSELVAYHGLVSVDKHGQPVLIAAADSVATVGAQSGSEGSWQSVPADSVPWWLSTWPVQLTAGIDPFAPRDDTAMQRLRRIEEEGRSIECVSVCGDDVVYSVGGELGCLSQRSRAAEKSALSIGAAVSCLSLTEAVGKGATLRGIASSGGRRLVLFEQRDGKLLELWHQTLTDCPCAVSFLGAPQEGGDEPDVIVVLRNNGVYRLRHLGSKLTDLWKDCWTRLAIATVDDAVEAVRNHSICEQLVSFEALLIRAVDLAIEGVRDAELSTRSCWVDGISELFAPDRSFLVLRGPMQLILRKFRDHVKRGIPGLYPLDSGEAFFPALVHRIYFHEGTLVEIRVQIDREMRSLDWKRYAKSKKDKNIQSLKKRRFRNRFVIWKEREKEVAQSRRRPVAHAVEHASFALERWVSAFLPTYSVHLGRRTRWLVLSGADSLRCSSEGRLLVVANRRKITAYRLKNYEEIDFDDPLGQVTRESDGIRGILKVASGDQDSLLVLYESGNLSRIVVTEGGSIAEDGVAIWSASRSLGAARALTGCPHPRGGMLVVVLLGSGRHSTAVLLHIAVDQIRELCSLSLALPAVSCIDVAATADGWLLATASTGRAPFRVHTLDGEGREQACTTFRNLPTGALAVRFDAKQDPRFLIATEGNGFVWCVDPRSESEINDLYWAHRFSGPVHSVATVQIDEQPHFVCGSDHGDLTLLRATDGQRRWEHQMLSPVRHVVAIEGVLGPALVVLMREGWLALFSLMQERNTALKRLKGCITEIADHSEAGFGAEARAVEALMKVEHRQQTFASVLPDVKGREQRARVIRCLAERLTVTGESAEMGNLAELFDKLHPRDLMLLLSYLPVERAEWDPMILRALKLPASDIQDCKQDRLDRSEMAARVYGLQRFAMTGPTLSEVIDHVPPRHAFGCIWVLHEYARILVQAAVRGADDSRESKPLLVALLPELLRLPPQLIGACAEVIKDHPTGNELKVLAYMLEDHGGSLGAEPGNLARLAGSVRSLAEDDDLCALGHALIELFFSTADAGGGFGPSEDDEPRGRQLDAIRLLADCCISLGRADPPLDQLVTGLRRLLPESPLPQDHEQRIVRIAWLDRAKERLTAAKTDKSPFGQHPWRDHLERLLEGCRYRIDHIIRGEDQHLLMEVRPFLALADTPVVDPANKAHLRIDVVPEGVRILRDVTIVLSAEGQDGLLLPGNLIWSNNFRTYPGPPGKVRAELHGFVRPGQGSVIVTVELQDDSGYRYRGEQHFKLVGATPTGGLTIQSDLPKTFLVFLESLLEIRAPLVLAVIDRGYGQRALVEAWCARAQAHCIDIDALTREVGEKRRYSDQRLDLGLLQSAHVTKQLPTNGESTASVEQAILWRVDETLERLLSGEAPGVLEAWIGWLQGLQGGPLVMVVSSVHATRVRQLWADALPEVAVHRALLGGHRSLLEEAMQVVMRETTLPHQIVEQRLDDLGYDVRLVLRWLRWHKENIRRSHADTDQVARFLELDETRELLRRELASLHPIDLIMVLVGAETTTQVPVKKVIPGLYADQEYRSHPKGGATKLIQERGRAFSSESVTNLKSDRDGPANVRIEGFGRLGTAESKRPALHRLVTSRPVTTREESYQRLVRLGVATYEHELFRTRSPYRQYISWLYSKAPAQPERQDSWVLQQITGEERSPLSSLSLAELLEMNREEVQHLMPGSSQQEIAAALRVGRLWSGDEKDLEGAFESLFRPRTVRRIQRKDIRWDRSIAACGFPVLGIGMLPREIGAEAYPEEYLIWVGMEPEVNVPEIGAAVDEAADCWFEHELSMQRESDTYEEPGQPPGRRLPRVILIGPGVESVPDDPSRLVAILRSRDLCETLWEGNITAELVRKARSHMRLTALSPFQTSGPLPPGSPYFFGREDELEYIKRNLRRVSILIVGGRRVGKTSLLNQVRYWAQHQRNLEPIFIDLQQVETRQDFDLSLQAALKDSETPPELRKLAGFSLDEVVDQIRSTGKLPVLLLNEIDGLAYKDSNVVKHWRALSDKNRARFVMVAYSSVALLGDPEGPLFHFTEGQDFGGKAIAPTALSIEAARLLLGMVTNPVLGLRWADATQQQAAHERLLERSYCIPWVLQRYGQLLVEHMERVRRAVITLADVDAVLDSAGQVVWRYFDSIDYSSLDTGEHDTAAQRTGFRLVLFTLARQRYFLGGAAAPIRDPNLRGRPALAPELGFTVGEAKEAFRETLGRLLLRDEAALVMSWFDHLDLRRALRLLTLTLTLEPDPGEEDRYGFLHHILPLELKIRFSEHPTLDDLIINSAAELMRLLKKGPGNSRNAEGENA